MKNKVPKWMGVAVFTMLLVTSLGCDNSSPPAHTPPTEREKQEAGTRAILRKYGRPGQSEAEIDRGAKSVVDEWEKASNKR